jgi:hypothetical protein
LWMEDGLLWTGDSLLLCSVVRFGRMIESPIRFQAFIEEVIYARMQVLRREKIRCIQQP